MQQSSSASATATSLNIPLTPSSASSAPNKFSYSLFASTSVRSYPSVISPGPATASGAFSSAGTFGTGGPNGITPGVPFQEFDPSISPPSQSRRILSIGTGGTSTNVLRKSSLSRKRSLGNLNSAHQQQEQEQEQQLLKEQSRFLGFRRRANSSSSVRDRNGGSITLIPGSLERAQLPAPVYIDNGSPPALPEFALASAAKLTRDASVLTSMSTLSRTTSNSMDSTGAYMQSGGRMISRAGTLPVNGFATAGAGMMPPPSAAGLQGEAAMVHQHVTEMANKRISTLEYLRKAHEGRVYWFNTLLFDKPDLARMPYFDNRRLARRATNYLLLGLSLPTVIDFNSNSPIEFLRSFNLLLTEFESFQSLHPETGSTASTLARARIPNLNVFRRATPSAKSRRSSSANNEILYEDGASMANGGLGGGIGGTGGGGGSISGMSMSSAGGSMSVGNGLGGSASVVQFGQSEPDLLPGEDYIHLLTPSLPFDPDFFETFATLCDVLIDAYARLLGLLSTPRDCNAAVAELFTKADSRVRKIIVQGVVKEFEDTSRNGVRSEVANVGKIVLGGLM